MLARGTVGSYDAADINYATRFLAGLVEKHTLPPKILAVHRFTPGGVTNARKISLDPRVQLVMHMDGFGPSGMKLDSYWGDIKREPVQFTGWKQFTKAKNDLSFRRSPGWTPCGSCAATRTAGGRSPCDSRQSRIEAGESYWSPDDRTVYLKSLDAMGNSSIWSVPLAGGAPMMLVRFDDPMRPSFRPNWALGPHHIYFPIEDRQSDIRVMDLVHP